MPVTLEEFADACPIDGGGFFRGDWFYRNWEIDHPNLAKAHINLKETFTVLLTLCRWKSHLRDKWVVVHSDNHVTISALKEHVAIHKSCNGFVISFGFPALTIFGSLRVTYCQRLTQWQMPSRTSMTLLLVVCSIHTFADYW